MTGGDISNRISVRDNSGAGKIIDQSVSLRVVFHGRHTVLAQSEFLLLLSDHMSHKHAALPGPHGQNTTVMFMP